MSVVIFAGKFNVRFAQALAGNGWKDASINYQQNQCGVVKMNINTATALRYKHLQFDLPQMLNYFPV